MRVFNLIIAFTIRNEKDKPLDYYTLEETNVE